MNPSDHSLQRYSRHLLLPEVGFEGHEKIRSKTALIVGMGGLGCPASLYLTASGVGRLILVDHDVVDLTNLQRQILYTDKDVGQSKALCAQRHLQKINPDVHIEALVHKADEAFLSPWIALADVVLDGTDRFATRHMMNRACRVGKKPLVIASALRFDGQMMVVDPRDDSPCYECVFPEHEGANETSCALMGVFSPMTGVMGSLQAMTALKILANLPLASSTLMMLSGLSGFSHTINLIRSPHCPYHDSPSKQILG